MKKSKCNYGRSRNLEFTIVDSCLAQTKSHSQIDSLALTVAMWRHWSREPIRTLSGPSISMFSVVQTDYPAGRIFMPHRLFTPVYKTRTRDLKPMAEMMKKMKRMNDQHYQRQQTSQEVQVLLPYHCMATNSPYKTHILFWDTYRIYMDPV